MCFKKKYYDFLEELIEGLGIIFITNYSFLWHFWQNTYDYGIWGLDECLARTLRTLNSWNVMISHFDDEFRIKVGWLCAPMPRNALASTWNKEN